MQEETLQNTSTHPGHYTSGQNLCNVLLENFDCKFKQSHIFLYTVYISTTKGLEGENLKVFNHILNIFFRLNQTFKG